MNTNIKIFTDDLNSSFISIIGHLLPLKAIVATQQPLVLLVCTELDGSVWDDSHHGGRVPPPQTEEAILQVGAVYQPVGLLCAHKHIHAQTLFLSLYLSM